MTLTGWKRLIKLLSVEKSCYRLSALRERKFALLHMPIVVVFLIIKKEIVTLTDQL